MIDLHTHTNGSDGVLSASALVQLAKDSGLDTIAITDHDTTRSIEEAIKTGAELEIEVVAGIELSCNHHSIDKEIHLVGLFIDYQSSSLQNHLAKLGEFRKNRNEKLLEELANIGLTIDEAELFNVDGYQKTIVSIGKPDFARALYKAGHIKRETEAYGKYLDDKKGLIRVSKEKVSIAEAIQMIHDAGGLAILAHPFHITRSFEELYNLVSDVKEEGLDGMEVFYHNYDKKQVKNLKKIAEKFGLLKSGGSDFHSPRDHRHTKLGFFGIKKNIPDDILSEMKRVTGK